MTPFGPFSPLLSPWWIMVLWGTVRVDFRSEKHPMAVDRSLDVSDGSGFNGFDGGGLHTWFENLKR